MKFKFNEIVYFKPNINRCVIVGETMGIDPCGKIIYEIYIIDDEFGNRIGRVKEDQLLSQQEYRKLKLQKLNEIDLHR